MLKVVEKEGEDEASVSVKEKSPLMNNVILGQDAPYVSFHVVTM